MAEKITLSICDELKNTDKAHRLAEKFGGGGDGSLVLRLDKEGLSLVSGQNTLRGDYTRMLRRVANGKIQTELLVRAARMKGKDEPTVFDATAGLGEDSFILAAAGFHVTLCEKNQVIFELLRDSIERAEQDSLLFPVAERMTIINGDSVEIMKSLPAPPDVILLDPMFPERQKSALVKKKLQMIQKLEAPCDDESTLLLAAAAADPKKLIVKRPPRGPFLGNVKPDYSITGKAVRFDCFVSPRSRLIKP